MKLIDLYEAAKDPVAAILAGVEASLVRHATVHSFDVDEECINFEVVYEFPEHRTGLVQQVRKALAGVGKVAGEKGGDDMGLFGMAYQIVLKQQLTPEQEVELKKTVTQKYTPAL